MRKPNAGVRWLLGLIAVGALLLPIGGAAREDVGSAEPRYATDAGTVAPSPPTAERQPPGARAESRRLYERLIGMRRALAAKAAARPQAPAPIREISLDPTSPQAETRFHGSPAAFIATTKENTLADDVGKASQVTEPSAVNEGRHVTMAGNWYRSRSGNQGTTWTNIAIPAGPATAPTFCCDIDTLYDASRAVTFQSLFYFRDFDADPNPDNGVVRIMVRRQPNLAENCSYDIDPDGASDNVLPDFPHIALSNDYLYLSTNELTNGGGQTAKVRRFNVDQLADCVDATTNTFSLPSATIGQRVLRPVEGAKETMYWAALLGSASSTTMRLFKWPETSASVTSQDIALGETSLFGDTDCRGGTNNTDWWDPLTASVTGFELVGAVGGNTITFVWDAKGGAGHTQGHVHGLKLRESPTIVKTADIAYFNSGFCIGYPAIASNERGDFGLSLAAGGKSGGAGPAVQAWVGLDDDLDGGTTDFVVARSGTHNPANGRYGDYFTVHQHEPCDQFFTGTNYVFTGGGAAPNVDALYVTFGRGREKPCFDGWTDEDRVP
jgi:hypothetical protein